ncbi:type VI secretion system-associated lipoprotein TagQ [Pseudomonas alliivorans]|uniref:type VI secretion system-associated lipoprotein TagQ n=1 Tax=Pseudomonas alliivorans TaxID=2810613 RepID=UPI001AE6D9B9|nr:type VI secretion system-associated lipoprotein TagQ [Pseudomonas alliivorans]MBP0943495.1 type VI secretion-associated lipoprotein TagQ [Pseudomonas alliivorans]MEE4881796.1 type VI secretion system-associated lipoprotein TagQ [Pseudomonas alliivorans]MEE4933094.1 type VI secretion system-associated lipoprotein TagQ [Pseudomonas alliivorans]MEE4938362.1 type VI secretion system-associated lipoprotein TagQ [Pseudomonas alliivorans]MEE4943541.1 type VI secretion system-associated lipoprotein
MLLSRKPFVSASKSRALLLATAGFGAVLLTGCASSPVSKVGASTKVEYYPTCYEPVQHLRQTDSDMTKSVATGAALGAVGGALAGALTGDSDKRARNVAIGAAGGALVGGAAGYYTERQKQITDDNARIASYSTDINKSAADIDRSTAYAKASQSCYQREFTSLISGRKANTINATEGRKRLAEIVAGLKESNDLIAAVNGRAGEDLSSYTQAYEKDLQQVGVKRNDVVVVANAETAPVAATSNKKGGNKKSGSKKLPDVPKEAVGTEKNLQQAKVKQAESAQVANAGQTQVNSMCKNPDVGDWAPVPCPNV